jgi:hypothetical protein
MMLARVGQVLYGIALLISGLCWSLVAYSSGTWAAGRMNGDPNWLVLLAMAAFGVAILLMGRLASSRLKCE